MWAGKSLATVDCSITLKYHWLLFLVDVPNSLEDVVRSTEYVHECHDMPVHLYNALLTTK